MCRGSSLGPGVAGRCPGTWPAGRRCCARRYRRSGGRASLARSRDRDRAGGSGTPIPHSSWTRHRAASAPPGSRSHAPTCAGSGSSPSLPGMTSPDRVQEPKPVSRGIAVRSRRTRFEPSETGGRCSMARGARRALVFIGQGLLTGAGPSASPAPDCAFGGGQTPPHRADAGAGRVSGPAARWSASHRRRREPRRTRHAGPASSSAP